MLLLLPKDVLLWMAGWIDVGSLTNLLLVCQDIKKKIVPLLEWKQLTNNGIWCFTRQNIPSIKMRYDMFRIEKYDECVPYYLESLLTMLEDIMWHRPHLYHLVDQDGIKYTIKYCGLRTSASPDCTHVGIYSGDCKEKGRKWYLGNWIADKTFAKECLLKYNMLEGHFQLDKPCKNKTLCLSFKGSERVAPVFDEMYSSSSKTVAFDHDLRSNKYWWQKDDDGIKYRYPAYQIEKDYSGPTFVSCKKRKRVE